MTRGLGWVWDRPWLIALVVFVAVVIPGFLRVQQISDRTDGVVACVSRWADLSATRSAALAAVSGARNDALDALLRAAAAGDVPALQAKLTAYVTASDRFNTVSKANPVPVSPKLVC